MACAELSNEARRSVVERTLLLARQVCVDRNQRPTGNVGCGATGYISGWANDDAHVRRAMESFLADVLALEGESLEASCGVHIALTDCE